MGEKKTTFIRVKHDYANGVGIIVCCARQSYWIYHSFETKYKVICRFSLQFLRSGNRNFQSRRVISFYDVCFFFLSGK